MTKLWQKGYRLNEQVERFEGAQNSTLDNKLIHHDVWGSLAHAAMLKKIGILQDDEYQDLQNALCNILLLEKANAFTVSPADEDVHTSVENYLVAEAGAAGKKIHMARSRNDQVLVDLRLYGKEQLHDVAAKMCQLISALLDFSSAHADVPMPGYTHMQRAMLSSVGLWAASYSEALLDDEKLLTAAYILNDQSPLGSAAGYGVPLAIDRQYCADLLGFSRVQHNVIYVQNSRGKIEAAIVQALAQIMLDLSKLAQDILLFTTVEYGFFQIAQELCTGSSIMPQKRNLGIMELVRARTQTMLALQQQILGIVSGLPSGYNMDYQETKRPFMEALDLVQESLEICTLVVNSLGVNTERLTAACTFELFAADRAYELTATANLPFRDAYRIVGAEVTAQLDRNMPMPVESQEQLIKRLSARNHIGGAGNLGLAVLHNQLELVNSTWEARAESFAKAIESLAGAASTVPTVSEEY
ncbi:MAG TPA: argininosuccinate lyase [Ktedonobacter sp.]|jgi:argininosuccinate lyase|nr:argininosuccinate lyase [Ktedonobacter sp.]HAT44477.1 argininosuccinate lyase [Ktedonobacter sp.]HBE24808.1 argininosuccinate lyase [Ktedonobacter sp.]HCF87047.1 argininosuccinate lyase [Ktedonobacter sp.]HCP74640.1 argininosuccinate lyase [Ktedonobacter sp.]